MSKAEVRSAQVDGVFTIRHRTVAMKSTKTPIVLIPVGDIHWDSKACDRELFKDTVQSWRTRIRKGENLLFIGVGDFFDFASTKERKAFAKADLHDTTRDTFDDLRRMQVVEFCKQLEFTKGRWLGFLDGNHRWQTQKGETCAQLLCNELGGDYLGTFTHYTLRIERYGRHSACQIVAAHGKCGGKLVGTSINSVADLKQILPSADIYLMGHSHDRGCWPTVILEVRPGVTGESILTSQRQWLCRTGSFLRSYQPGIASYPVSRLLKPVDLGTIELQIFSNRVESNHKSAEKIRIKAIT
jgi:hypothetical protein